MASAAAVLPHPLPAWARLIDRGLLDGWLDPEGGALLTTALNPLMKPLPHDGRTASQRRFEALMELCRRQLDGGGLPTVGGQKPHLYVTVPVETLRGEPDRPAARCAGPARWSGKRRAASPATRCAPRSRWARGASRWRSGSRKGRSPAGCVSRWSRATAAAGSRAAPVPRTGATGTTSCGRATAGRQS